MATSFPFYQFRSSKKSLSLITTPHCRRQKSFQNRLIYHDIFGSKSSSQILVHFKSFSISTKTRKNTSHLRKLEVLEFSVSDLNSCGNKDGRDEALRTLRSIQIERSKTWEVVPNARETKAGNNSSLKNELKRISEKALWLLLPAQYPQSVARGYLGFVSFCFTASIAGSAAMVLSTQNLLLAIGIVGQSNGTSSVMAGALNWVMKDFMGQLGGIVFASQMGKTKSFDNDPKRWRMVAAIALDGATMLEILSPLCHHNLVLPVASIANIGKNIGFLTASASRAALHQSLAISGNLGDVTVKAGSQSMTASLIGTSLGIGLSTLLHHDTFNFGICFLCLSAIHQGCTYLSLQKVPLSHFNRHRLYLAMEHYLKNQTIPSPIDVAKIERFFPFISCDSSSEWLHIGRPLREVCRNHIELENCLASATNESYLIKLNEISNEVDLIFFTDAKEQDLYRGIYHACLIRYKICQMAVGSAPPTSITSQVNTDGSNRDSCTCNINYEKITAQTIVEVQQSFTHIFEELHTRGWNTSSGVTDIEDKKAHRIQINVL